MPKLKRSTDAVDRGGFSEDEEVESGHWWKWSLVDGVWTAHTSKEVERMLETSYHHPREVMQEARETGRSIRTMFARFIFSATKPNKPV